MQSLDGALAKFDALSGDILKVLTSKEIETKKRGKTAARIIDVLKEVERENFSPSPHVKNILKNYAIRNTRQIERKRKQDYIGDFDSEKSDALKIISERFPGESFDVLKTMVDKVIKCEKKHELKMNEYNRAALRSKTAMYKFIQANLDTFNKYFDAGMEIVEEDVSE